MKNNVSCPKCGGTEIIKIPGKAGAYGSGNNIMIGMTIFSAILVNRYVCSDCGYSEEWIDTKDLEKLKDNDINKIYKKWERAYLDKPKVIFREYLL